MEDERLRRIDTLPREGLEKGNCGSRFIDRATEDKTEMYREEAEKELADDEAQCSTEADTQRRKLEIWLPLAMPGMISTYYGKQSISIAFRRDTHGASTIARIINQPCMV